MTGKKISWTSLFVALSIVGAALKVPSPVGSVALDAFPALLAGVLLGSGVGAIVGGVGHLLSALIGGMPMGPFHFIVAMEMAALIWLFSGLYVGGKRKMATVFFLIGNTFLAPLPFLFLLSKAFYVGLLPALAIASALNTTIALILIPRLTPIFKGYFSKKEEAR